MSGVRFNEDGQGIIAVSDEGMAVTGTLRLTEDRLTGLDSIQIIPMAGQDGKTLTSVLRDAETIETDGAGGYWVAFEQRHRLWRMRQIEGQLRWTGEALLPPIPTYHGNKGIEALVRLPDGRLLALAESVTLEGQERTTTAFLWDGTQWHHRAYPQKEGFWPTDMSLLPDGSLMVLERAISLNGGFRSRIMRLPAGSIDQLVLTPELVAELSELAQYENMEGLAVWPLNDGSVRIVIVSDDNFRLWQKSLLLMFEYPYSR